MDNARKVCLRLLMKMERDLAYSNILLNDALLSSDLTLQDKKFVSAMFYGVLERLITLDKIIEIHSSKPIDKLSHDVKQILRMGIYQLKFMNSVPDNAAVDECVKLVKERPNSSASGFVNAVLRSFIRADKRLPIGKTRLESLSFEYSCPEWLCKKWLDEFGEQAMLTLLETSLGRAPITVKVNTLTTDCDTLVQEFSADGINANELGIVDNCLEVFSSGALEATEAYKLGKFHVQDISSQLCCEALDAKQGETVLDLCSAPGGKAFTLAEMMNNQGRIFAFDLHKNRVKLIKNGALRLGLTIISAEENNAKLFNEKIPTADKVLCDVPCSGLGVIRRKPEIKYKNPADFEGLPAIQFEILSTSAKYLKVGGELVYSTCTVSKAENDEVIDRFLKENPEFEGVSLLENRGAPFGSYKATILPDYCNSDGFFIAKIRRTR